MVVWNREPLAPNALAQLPPGSIEARGWLQEQLRLSADGLTGHMMEIWPDVGPDSGWLGGKGENWERGPYYARGLVSLAHALGDTRLRQRAGKWIDWSLGSQRPDGFFGPPDNDDWWPRMPMLDALRWHYDATEDERVPSFMQRYFRYQLERLPAKPLDAWAKPRGGDNIDSVLWLYNRTGDRFLLDLADLLHQQTGDWIGELSRDGPPSEGFELGHGVNRAMGFKEPAVYFQRSRDPSHLRCVRNGWMRTNEHHGQIQGTYSCDEFLHGRGSTQGAELCTIVELLSSFETVLKISGEAWLGDAVERLAYNALPSMFSADLRAHQYFQLPNQIECTPGGRNFHIHHETDLLFGVAPGYGCCAANLHMGWPRLVNHLWLATRDGGLAAVLLAPCRVTASVGDGQRVSVLTQTSYPFGEEARFIVQTASVTAFPLLVRIPSWADEFALSVNGEPVSDPERKEGFVVMHRAWRDGDTVLLRLPMRVRLTQCAEGAVAVERGPLVYALRVGEEWRAVGGAEPFLDYEVRPTTAWNYGLIVDRSEPETSIRVETKALEQQPWARDGSSVRLRAKGKRIPDWVAVNGSAGEVPQATHRPETAEEALTLIPFGCARLRIAMFPIIS
jgi:hypothetical protein